LRAVSYRVLHVDTERGWRGGERQALWLARELARRGHLSVVAARSGEPLEKRGREEALDVIDCSPRFEADPTAALRLRRAIQKHEINIVHAHTAHAVAIGASATIGMAVPLVVARRVDFPLRANVGTRWKYGRAAAIIAISNAVARVLERSGIPAGRIHVVPDGVDTQRKVTPATRDQLGSLGVPAGAPLVVQVSQLVGHKDPLNFVRAVARLHECIPTAHALLVGDGPLRDEVEHEVQRLGLGPVLHVTGYRTDADALLAAANVASLSSREEGMGSVLLDALAFGVPIAATRAGGIPEVVEDGENGLLADVADPNGLGNAMARLLTEEILVRRLKRNAAARADHFSVERMTDRTMSVYKSVLSKAAE
jgi:glycosyltransferase involved in cell wall biosynthesis